MNKRGIILLVILSVIASSCVYVLVIVYLDSTESFDQEEFVELIEEIEKLDSVIIFNETLSDSSLIYQPVFTGLPIYTITTDDSWHDPPKDDHLTFTLEINAKFVHDKNGNQILEKSETLTCEQTSNQHPLIISYIKNDLLSSGDIKLVGCIDYDQILE